MALRKRAICAVAGAALAASAPTAAAPGSGVMSDLGLMIDVGLPHGAMASVTFSPAPFVRAHAGLGHNAISPGVRAGATYLPLRLPVAPVLSAEIGHHVEGDAGDLARFITGTSPPSGSPLERVGYDVASARVGLEVAAGRTRIFLHAGLSYLRGTVYDASDALSRGEQDGGPRLEVRDDPEVRALLPSARAGLVITF